MPFKTLILVNQTGSDITLEEFGSLVVPASGQIDITNTISYSEFSASSELMGYLDADEIRISDGTQTLSQDESISYTGANRSYREFVVNVAKSGTVAYTSIQDAIDSVTVGAGERYVISISPGVYEEAITMKNGITLRGEGTFNDVIVSQSSGTTLTVPTGSCSFQDIAFKMDCTGTNIPICVEIQGGNAQFLGCHIDIDCENGIIGGIDISGGMAGFQRCKFTYDHTGTGVGVAHMLHASGTGSYRIRLADATMNVVGTDSTDYCLFILDESSSSLNRIVESVSFRAYLATGWDGHVGFWKTTNPNAGHFSESNYITIETTSGGSNSIGYAYDIDTSGSGEIKSIGALIKIIGNNSNYSAEISSGDTVVSHFDDIEAADGYTGAGEFNFANSPSSGDLQVSGSYLEMYSQSITVSKTRGGDYTSIQDAVDSITDAASDKQYVILVYPGTYSESVDLTGKPYIDIKGTGNAESTVIQSVGGTALTFDDGAPTTISFMTLQSVSASNTVIIPSGSSSLYTFDTCIVQLVNTNTFGAAVDIGSGTVNFITSRIQYVHSGTGGGTHKLIDITGASSLVMASSDMYMSIAATGDDAIAIAEANATISMLISGTRLQMFRSGTVTGETTAILANGDGSDQVLSSSQFILSNQGSGGVANGIKTSGNGCTFSLQSNRFKVIGFTTNYGFYIAATDTVESYFDSLQASDEVVELGDYKHVHAHLPEGDFHVHRDILLERNLEIDGTIAFDGGTAVGNIDTSISSPGVDTSLVTEKAVVDWTNGLAALYVKKDGTTPFTGTQVGVTPTLDSHLTTKAYVDAVAQGGGTNDLGPFISRTDPEPLSPSDGDKYLVPEETSNLSDISEDSESSGLNWVGKENQVAEWSDSEGRWVFTVPEAGNFGYVIDEGIQYNFNGDEWLALGTNISHTVLQDIGTNTHSQIDSHIASTSNPHSVTKTQVSLGNVTDDAQLKRSANDFSTFTEKTAVVNADLVLIEDSGDSGNKKKVQAVNLPDQLAKVSSNDTTSGYLSNKIIGTTNKITVTEINDGGNESLQINTGSDFTTLTDGSNADALHEHAHSNITGQTVNDHHNQSHAFAGADHTTSSKANVDGKISDASLISTLSGEINGITEKLSPVSADLVLIEDSADSNNKKKVQLSNLPVNAHLLGGTSHTADTKANLDTKVSDASLISTLGAEISTITEKTTPVAADLLLIEDSTATNAKKRIQIGNLPLPTVTEASSTTTITTTSTTYVLMTGMTLTPASGTYMVWFSTSVSNNDSNGATSIAIHSGGTIVQHTERTMSNDDDKMKNHIQGISTNGKVTVNGAQAIEIRWNQANGGTATAYERTLNIMKVQ